MSYRIHACTVFVFCSRCSRVFACTTFIYSLFNLLLSGESTVVVGELADPAASWIQALEAAERKESEADTEDAADQNESASSTDQHGQKYKSATGVKGSTDVPGQTTKEALRAIQQREGWYFTLPSEQPQQQPQERNSKEQPAAVVTSKVREHYLCHSAWGSGAIPLSSARYNAHGHTQQPGCLQR